MNRTIFLIDMNAYFASVEQQINPALRGKPIAICGKGRTVVTTASYEARAFGVKTGMSLPEAKRYCPMLIPVYGNMSKYIDTSLQIHKILLEYTDLVEPFSIDECFLDVSHLCKKPDDAVFVAREIKQKIKSQLGLLCSIGVGPNKIVAKLGSKFEKPDGLTIITQEDIPSKFQTLTLEKMQGIGIGKKTAAKLQSMGIHNAKELGAAKISLLTHHFGIVGHYLKNIGNGIDTASVKTYSHEEQIKSVGHSHTLPKNTGSISVANSYLLMLAHKVGQRLRSYALTGRTVQLVIRYGDFTGRVFNKSASDDIYLSDDIYRYAQILFKKCLPLQKSVRMLGITISSLSPSREQKFLFEYLEKKHKFSAAVDSINEEFGRYTVKPSAMLISDKFGIKEGCGMVPKPLLKEKS